MNLIQTFSILTIIMTSVAIICLIMLHVLPTGYTPIRDAVSDYGVGSYRGWFWLQVVAGGLACLFLAIALSQLRPFTPTNVVIALLVTTVSRILLPFFATDQGGSRFQTIQGSIHMILAVFNFGGLVWAAKALWATLSHYPVWQDAESLLNILASVMLWCVIAVVVGLVIPWFKNFFGLFERLFLLSTYLWFFFISIELVRLG
ncbi:DUF998 domain-containing protein [Paenibacillus radicis (ex Gao et al. 2016)]|uniref:Membrane protein n=1 Tax=Paenibacillus radicis (ex Gao et al. 2016) TaxID=1737354 RepID=A0A917GVD8_9BACL|nr:DUF998 domain-containing protein [Paenibacillus radicis (ex Gao et al. 2016)]GGG58008.1 membrane protein [Paenibacillus radicis (ex Gao et al. 2016)]